MACHGGCVLRIAGATGLRGRGGKISAQSGPRPSSRGAHPGELQLRMRREKRIPGHWARFPGEVEGIGSLEGRSRHFPGRCASRGQATHGPGKVSPVSRRPVHRLRGPSRVPSPYSSCASAISAPACAKSDTNQIRRATFPTRIENGLCSGTRSVEEFRIINALPPQMSEAPWYSSPRIAVFPRA
jgi:hypothetical protein